MLFLLLVGAALSVVLLRPVCEAMFAHAVVAHHPVECCDSVADKTAPDLADLATPGPGAKPVAGGVAYLIGKAFLPHTSIVFASPVLPARSYYTRTSRILR